MNRIYLANGQLARACRNGHESPMRAPVYGEEQLQAAFDQRNKEIAARAARAAARRIAIAGLPEAQRIGKRRANVVEWTSSPAPRRRLAMVPARQPSLTERIAAAAWRLHDGMPLVWCLMAATVLLASIGVTVALTAMALGWHS